MNSSKQGSISVRAMVASFMALGSVCLASLGSADETSSPATRGSLEQVSGVKIKKDARGRKVQYVDFGEAVIEGRAKTPDGFVIQSRTSGKFDSLIELRKDFRDRMSLNALETVTIAAPLD